MLSNKLLKYLRKVQDEQIKTTAYKFEICLLGDFFHVAIKAKDTELSHTYFRFYEFNNDLELSDIFRELKSFVEPFGKKSSHG